MAQVIALVGRVNVGKSTLFNRLTKTNDALVSNFSGLTRDRKYGQFQFNNRDFILIDTGGVESNDTSIDEEIAKQSFQALDEADLIFFVVDARSGIQAGDQALAQKLRQLNKQIFLVVNKTDGLDADVVSAEFYQLGLDNLHNISASHGRGVVQLMNQVISTLPKQIEKERQETNNQAVKIALVGRPNVGKSTMVNRILNEERVVVFDMPGTTTDSIYIPLKRNNKDYVLIDTAGVRRKSKVNLVIEKFSIIKTLQSIKDANVVLLVIDALVGISDQDLSLLNFIVDAGRAVVIVVNKWDNITAKMRTEIKDELDRRLKFIDFAKVHFVSALYGRGIGDLFISADKAYECAMQKTSTAKLTRILEQAVENFQPPLVQGRRIKLKYAHSGGNNPPIFVIHGNQVDKLPESYKKYLSNYFRARLKIIGTPIKLQFQSSENPFADKKNNLTTTQQRKRKRLLKFVK